MIWLEGSDKSKTPLYMTEPPEPSWFVNVAGVDLEIRVENGKPWIREAEKHHLWRATNVQ